MSTSLDLELSSLRLLDVRDVAAAVRLGPAAVRAAIHRGELRARRIDGGAWRVTPADQARWVGQRPPPSPTVDPQTLLTLAEVAALSGYRDRSLRTAIAAKRLTATKCGRGYRVTVANYMAWAGFDPI